MHNRGVFFQLGAFLLGVILIALAIWFVNRNGLSTLQNQAFDAQRAYQDMQYQVSMGPRVVGTEAHTKARDWMAARLKDDGWKVEIQNAVKLNHPVENVIAKRGEGEPWIILGAHYDSRMYADQDPDSGKRTLPVPGANDGASGIAVLLEIARILPKDIKGQVWIVMIDTEDNGDIPGWDWLLGSEAFVENLKTKPTEAVIIDMIGDANLNIYQERNSTPALIDEIWSQAKKLGYEGEFIPQYKYSMIDDHTPFLQAAIPAIDIIDFDYPYWHTVADTPDKVSVNSLKIVGETIQAWLFNQVSTNPTQ